MRRSYIGPMINGLNPETLYDDARDARSGVIRHSPEYRRFFQLFITSITVSSTVCGVGMRTEVDTNGWTRGREGETTSQGVCFWHNYMRHQPIEQSKYSLSVLRAKLTVLIEMKDGNVTVSFFVPRKAMISYWNRTGICFCSGVITISGLERHSETLRFMKFLTSQS